MINSLTGLRFYAAFLVFVHHAIAYFYTVPDGPLARLGQLGVSIFFVLSGFVLFINYLKPADDGNGPKTFSRKKFYVARFARIYPVFILTTLLAIPLQIFSSGSHGFWIPLLSNVFMLHCFAGSDTCHSFNDVGWTLSVESFFYVMFPVLALCFYRKAVWKAVIPVVLLLGYIVVFSQMDPANFYATKYFPVNRLLEFLLGMGVGYYYLYGNHGWFDQLADKTNMRWLGLGVVLLMFACQVFYPLLVENRSWGDEHNYLAYMMPSAVMILTLALMEKRNLTFAFLASPLAVLGGEISYSFYLIHNMVIRYFRGVLVKLNDNDLDIVKSFDPSLKIVSILVLLAIGLGGSYLLYKVVELPFRKKIRAALLK